MFYERYLELCKRDGISPSAGAIKAKFNKGTVSVWKKKYEEGKDVVPDPETIDKICGYFKCSENWLRNIPDRYILARNDDDEEFARELFREEKPAATEGNGLSNDAVEMGRIFDAAVPEIKERMKEVAEGKATKRRAVNVVSVKCPLDGSAQKIYQNVMCVGSDAFPSDLNNGCEMYHPCQECELCRMRAMFAELKGFDKK